MQRGRAVVTLPYIDKLNERAHFCSPERFRGRDQRPQLQCEIKNAKQARFVRPHLLKLESSIARERCESFGRVFIGILGENLFTCAKIELATSDMNALARFADQIHLDAAFVRIEGRVVMPLLQIEIGGEFAIGAREQVQIEFGGHARAVVVSSLKNMPIFPQIDANEQSAFTAA